MIRLPINVYAGMGIMSRAIYVMHVHWDVKLVYLHLFVLNVTLAYRKKVGSANAYNHNHTST